MAKKLFVIGVGPGSPKYMTEAAKDAIYKSQYIVGYRYTLTTIESIIDRNKQDVYEIDMENQEDIYQYIHSKMKEEDYCTVPFTGDVSFSESEVVDRLLEVFGNDNVEIIPGISSIQIAAAKSKVSLDNAYIVTFHVTGDIEQKKIELIRAVKEGKSVILLPRPWLREPSRNFMQSDIAVLLRKNGIDTSNLKVWVFEYLTQDGKETTFKGKVSDLEEMEFSHLSVMVIDQVKRQTYLQFD
ncbi:MAG TPA: precorrin-6y C5,15-methyltransferase (decarboxylating) subunit CbiE [Nitrososphaeraceae archaeon]|nr:precorrin-6y C5,15-methyltransferase (decarboxylating) subunit CbiE [Nitrososphaeraceae archaeon]